MKNVWGLSDSYKNSRSKPEGQAAKPSISPSSWVIKQSPRQRMLQLPITSSSFLVNIFLILNATFFFFPLRRVKLCTCPCVCVTVFERHLFMFSDIWPASFPYEALALQQRSCQCTFRNTQQLHVPYQGLFDFLTSCIQHDSLHNYLCFGDRISFRSFQVMPLHKILK